MIYEYFRKYSSLYTGRVALEIGSERYTYAELNERAKNIAKKLEQSKSSRIVGILAAKSVSAYSGVLGVLAAHRCFVPFTKKMPPAQIADILDETGVDTLIVGEEYVSYYHDVMAAAQRPLICIRPESEKSDVSISKTVDYGKEKKNDRVKWESDIAYILYTSGSTGKPKGIPVSHSNVVAYLKNVLPQYDIGPGDRCSQMFDLTFDPSIHDMFVTWYAGATLVIPNAGDIIAPRKFIIDRHLTVFATVPSTAYFMIKTRMLRPGDFLKLRYTLFTGEALSYRIYREWQLAAPNAQVINGYGPTELTINIAAYPIPAELTYEQCYNGIVPIGTLYDEHQMLILDENEDGIGELAVSGPQVFDRYINNKKKTAETFYEYEKNKYYRTGDLVQVGDGNVIRFVGRHDSQIKLRGYRVELSEIEACIKERIRGEVVVIAWPFSDSIAQGVVAFHDDPSVTDSEIIRHCRETLPEYMVPLKIRVLQVFPLNSNGKIDRNHLLEFLK